MDFSISPELSARLDEVRGRNPSLLSSGRTDPEVYRSMWQTLDEQGNPARAGLTDAMLQPGTELTLSCQTFLIGLFCF